MPVTKARTVLTGMQVREAMRRQVVRLDRTDTIRSAVNRLVKFKVNAVLVTDAPAVPLGVVSKTDIVAAFYAGLPLETPLEEIMTGPPLTCFPDDELDSSLDHMKRSGVHRLYVVGAESSTMAGTLSYPDVVALLYRYCRACAKSIRKRGTQDISSQRLRVRDVMTPAVVSFKTADSLARVMEGLMAHRFGAVLIQEAGGKPVGVISKTDLILAFAHGGTADVPAGDVMRSPIISCNQEISLSEAIRLMFLKDVQRLFVHEEDPSRIRGVLSLSDAAQTRSGSCRACLASRVMVNP